MNASIYAGQRVDEDVRRVPVHLLDDKDVPVADVIGELLRACLQGDLEGVGDGIGQVLEDVAAADDVLDEGVSPASLSAGSSSGMV